MMRPNIQRFSSAVAILAALSGCSSFHQANQLTDQAVSVAGGSEPPPTPIVTSSDAPYLLGTPIQELPATPAILDVPYTFQHGYREPLRQIAAEFSRDTGIPVDVSLIPTDDDDDAPATGPAQIGSFGGLPPPPSAFIAAMRGSGSSSSGNSDPVVSMWYNGTRGGFLDALAARAGVYYSFTNGRVKLFNQETKTFIIPSLEWPGTATTQITSGSSGSSQGAGLTGGGVGAIGAGTSGSSNTGAVTTNTTATTDIWKGLEADAKVVAGGAQISVDPNTSMVTVLGSPDQIEQVSDWVQNISDSLSKNVAIYIQVYNVQITNEQNYGFSPTVNFENNAKSVGLSVAGASMPTVLGTATPFKFNASILSGEFNSSLGAYQALATLGKVTQVISRSVRTVNNQQASLQNGTNMAYVYESQTSQAANVGTLSALIPSSINSGFTGTVKPLIVGDKIILGLDINLSDLLALPTFTSGGTSLQLPNNAQDMVDQVSTLRSGDSLLITGYQEADANTTHNGVGSPYMPLLGGGGDAQVKRNLLAIVVTAEVQ